MSRHGHETPLSSKEQQDFHSQNISSTSGGLFFADATLDLDEAHDIAETPEPPRRFLNMDANHTNAHPTLRLPQLDRLGSNLSTSSGNSLQNRSATNSRDNSRSVSPVQAAAPTILNTQPEGPSSSKSLSGPMNRITSGGNNSNGHYNPNLGGSRPRFRNRPRWPRDLPWAVAFCVVVPLGLLWPSVVYHRHNIFGKDEESNTTLTLPVLRHATFWGILLAYVSTLFIAHGLYQTAGGGEGDDLRYKASQFLLACVPMSVAMNVILVVAVYFLLPKGLYYALIPLWYLIRDVYLFRRWKHQGSGAPGSPTPASVHSSQPNSTRHAFFQALTCMALDILSRSLRRKSFHRCIVTLLSVQGIVAMIWRWAIMGALHTGNPITILMALVAGKWATGTIARLLSLIASGGVASWFAENAAMVEEQEMQERTLSSHNGGKSDNHQTSIEGGYDPSGIPEEYRSADASIYQSVLDFDDDGLDDDGQDDFEYGFASGNHTSQNDDDVDYSRADRSSPRYPRDNITQKATVKSFFLSGLSVSFGSVAQCGLLGGPAQFVWCQLRKVDATRTAIVHRLQQQPRDFQPNRAVTIVMGVTGVSANGGFRGMQIGQEEGTSVVQKLLNRANVIARAFVRAHSDLAMSHVAAYYKSYKRAALDVSDLVEQAGELLPTQLAYWAIRSMPGSIGKHILTLVLSLFTRDGTHHS